MTCKLELIYKAQTIPDAPLVNPRSCPTCKPGGTCIKGYSQRPDGLVVSPDSLSVNSNHWVKLTQDQIKEAIREYCEKRTSYKVKKNGIRVTSQGQPLVLTAQVELE